MQEGQLYVAVVGHIVVNVIKGSGIVVSVGGSEDISKHFILRLWPIHL